MANPIPISNKPSKTSSSFRVIINSPDTIFLLFQIYYETVSNSGLPQEPYRFKVAYDKLVIAVGAEPLTFNINGVKEHAYFLREVNHAQEIRKRLLLNLILSENLGISEEEKKRLLYCVIIGSGPTGVEFRGELSIFIMTDVCEQYSHVKDDVRVTLIECSIHQRGIHLKKGVVKEVHQKKIVLSDGTDIPYGMLVWSTRVRSSDFVKSLNLPKSQGGSYNIMCAGLVLFFSEWPQHIIVITVGGTKNGAFQLFCKQHAEGVWAVVDVSVDMNRDTLNSQTFMSSRRLPSSCVVQDMPNGYSK
ncbi:hypothetical protein GIB67_034859, partial [Kingdonia uniflora]